MDGDDDRKDREQSPREGVDSHPPKADRPGGPAQTGMNPVGPGQESPAPSQEAPPEDDTTSERQAHLQAKDQGP